jgi:hypothetical protein
MTKIIHPVAGGLAILTIATFWLSTTFAELLGSHAVVATVKTAIPWGFLVLIPALAATGGSGVSISKGTTGLVGKKRKRMLLIAANGLLILVPSALFLSHKVIELVAGATNITLLSLNFRDGLKMKGRFRRQLQLD